jgi:hypothetical protein
MSTAIPVWQILTFLGAALVTTSAWDWFRDQYEPTGHFGLRFTRRWYGTGAHVCFRVDADLEDPDWFRVIEWGDDSTDVPWVLIGPPDDEEFPPCWCPVTDLAPYAVRRLHPWIFRYGWLRIPMPFLHMPFRQPAGYLGTDA